MSDPYRPVFHFTPPSMWMNDPNGLVYFGGEYHLFYQYHPHSDVWGPMHWGHAVSRDLVNWQHLPIALYPDENGVIYSGSAVVDWNDSAGFGKEALVSVFTCKKDLSETQNLAYSTDRGRTWTKFAGNPVIPTPSGLRDFRDPKVFWHIDHWVMVLAAGSEAHFYTSPDLKAWLFSGRFGMGFGATDGVWETPDLFELPVDGGPEMRWVLTAGISTGGPAGGSASQYFVGQFDGATFTSENPPQTVLWADYGADFYAPQSWSDQPQARRIWLGWMNNWQYATLLPTAGWRGVFSLPREVTLTRTQAGIRLVQQPAAELQALRGPLWQWQAETLQPGRNLLQDLQLDTFELQAEVELGPGVSQFGLRVRVGNDQATTIAYDNGQQALSVDRSQSGQAGFKDGFAARHSAPLALEDNRLHLHLFVDSSTLEVFAAHGRLVFSEVIFPSPHSQSLELFVEGGDATLMCLKIFKLNPAGFYN